MGQTNVIAHDIHCIHLFPLVRTWDQIRHRQLQYIFDTPHIQHVQYYTCLFLSAVKKFFLVKNMLNIF